MTYMTKYRLSQGGFVVCLAGAVLSLWQLAGVGRSGDVGKAKFWFGALMVCVVIGLPLVIIFYYYRNRRFDVTDQQQIAVETLAKLGEQQRKDK